MAFGTSAPKSPSEFTGMPKSDLRSLFASQQPAHARTPISVPEPLLPREPAPQLEAARPRENFASQRPALARRKSRQRHAGVDELLVVLMSLFAPAAGVRRYAETKQASVIGMLMAYVAVMILGRILQNTLLPALMSMAGFSVTVHTSAILSMGTLGLVLEPVIGAALLSILFLLPSSIYEPYGRRQGFAALVLAAIYAMMCYLAMESLGTAIWVLTNDSVLLLICNMLTYMASLVAAGYLLRTGLGWSWQKVVILVMAIQIASDAQMVLLVWSGLIPVDTASVHTALSGL